MKITQDVRDYAREHGVDEGKALESGMAEKARSSASPARKSTVPSSSRRSKRKD